MTQPLLHEPLREWGIDRSVGRIDALLSGHSEAFLAEKDQLPTSGLVVSRWLAVDDSGARHQGRNGYVTQIGNDRFAWFASTESQSRIDFLQVLHAGDLRYACNDDTLADWSEEHLPKAPRAQLQVATATSIIGVEAWLAHLDAHGIVSARHRRMATEGALPGGPIKKGFARDLEIVSDGAGQFAILRHGLCWIHAERLVHKRIPLKKCHRQDQAQVRGQIWELYAELKAYRIVPDPALRPALEARFDAIITQQTAYSAANWTPIPRESGH